MTDRIDEAKTKNSKSRYVVAIILLAGMGAGGFFYYKKNNKNGVQYRESKVERGNIGVTITATGTVQPENRVDIKPPIAGRVEEVLVEEGNEVKKGQLLAWLSSTERAALLDVARAKGKNEVKRWENMYRPTPVLAPIDGMIILRNVESGQTFTNSDSILVMSDRLTVKAQVDETDIAQIKLKQPAEIILDAYPNEKTPAKVDQIAYEAKTVNNVTNYIVDVLSIKTPDFMRSGMTANVTFFVDSKEDILVIPVDALKVKDGKNIVLIPSSEGGPQEVEIETGITDGKRIEVVSGLDEGDTILAAQVKLKDKSKNKSNPFSPMGGPKPKKPGH